MKRMRRIDLAHPFSVETQRIAPVNVGTWRASGNESQWGRKCRDVLTLTR